MEAIGIVKVKDKQLIGAEISLVEGPIDLGTVTEGKDGSYYYVVSIDESVEKVTSNLSFILSRISHTAKDLNETFEQALTDYLSRIED